MKYFVAVLLALLQAGTARGQDKPDNGFWWGGLSSDYKLGFVYGHVHAMSSVMNLMSLRCLEEAGKQHPGHNAITECLQSPEVARYDFTGIRVGQFTDGVDMFYKDRLNKNLEVDFALKYVRDKLKGKSPEGLEQELKTFRDISSQSQPSK
jgi:hypothetical protein